MLGKTAALAGLLMLGALAAPPTSAAPLAPVGSGIAAQDSLVQQTHWRHRHRWRRHCRRVCHGHMHWSEHHGWRCHGDWHYRCHRHD